MVDLKPLPQVAVTNNDPFCSTACCRTWYRLDEEAVSINYV